MDVLNINISAENFETNSGDSLKDLFEDEVLSDITFVCSDERQIKAHKIILSSRSSFFKNMFKTNNNCKPIIYMRGVNSDEMRSVLSFIYLGETEINQTSLNKFIGLAKDLGLKGLSETFPGDNNSVNKIQEKESEDNIHPLEQMSNHENETVADFEEDKVMGDNVTDYLDYCKTGNEPEKYVKKSSAGERNDQKQRRRSCKTIRKVDYTLRDYCDVSGLDFYALKADRNGMFACTDCEHVNKSRSDLAKHFLNKHVSVRLECEECSEVFHGFQRLQYHKRIVHKGICFPCKICPYKGNQSSNLKTHMLRYH